MSDSHMPRRTSFSRVLMIGAMLLVVYCSRCLVHMLGLLKPQIREGFYISVPTSERRHCVHEWISAQNVTFPVTHVPGVRVNASTFARLQTKQLAPDTRGQAGCRLAHLNPSR
jgi:hypothetical protein